MKRYIRLKNGEIYDTKRIIPILVDDKRFENGIIVNGIANYIVGESDNILGLIDYDSDLFEYSNTIWSANHLNNAINFDINDITKLYTKQGDNYVLVWDKERGVI